MEETDGRFYINHHKGDGIVFRLHTGDSENPPELLIRNKYNKTLHIHREDIDGIILILKDFEAMYDGWDDARRVPMAEDDMGLHTTHTEGDLVTPLEKGDRI